MKMEENEVRIVPDLESGPPTASVHVMGADGKVASAELSAKRLLALGSHCSALARKMMGAER